MNAWVTVKEKFLEHLVGVVFGVYALLLLAIWKTIPSSVWMRVDSWVPKQVLWAALALVLLSNICIATYKLLKREERKLHKELEAENAVLKSENSALKQQLQQAGTKTQALEQQVKQLTHRDSLSEESGQILAYLSRVSSTIKEELVENLRISPTLIDYSLHDLLRDGYVELAHTDLAWDEYRLSQKGRKYLIDNNLLR
jgi:hypothetical protein